MRPKILMFNFCHMQVYMHTSSKVIFYTFKLLRSMHKFRKACTSGSLTNFYFCFIAMDSDSNHSNQDDPVIIGEPIPLSVDVVAPEFSDNSQNLNVGNHRTIIYIINSPLIAPLSSSSSPSSPDFAIPTMSPNPSSSPPKSPHVPLTPPPTPPSHVDSACSSSTVTRKRKCSKEENATVATQKRIYKHQIDLNDEAYKNLPEKLQKSILKSKNCKEQREKKAAYLAQLETDNERLRQENAIIPILKENISRLEEEIKCLKANLNKEDAVRPENAPLEVPNADEQIDDILSDKNFLNDEFSFDLNLLDSPN